LNVARGNRFSCCERDHQSPQRSRQRRYLTFLAWGNAPGIMVVPWQR
jgi:hypothetical protein